MKIIRLQIHHIRLPLKKPWSTAYGIEDSVESVLIKAYTKDHDAWVESCPLKSPLYSPETAVTVFQMIRRFFGSLVLGKEIEESHSISQLFKPFRGNSFAKAGVEQCWWALNSIQENVPLRRLFGGTDLDVPVGGTVGIKDSIDHLIKAIEKLVEKGSQRVKLKIKKGWDVEVVRRIRERFPNLRLQVDCNGSYTLGDLKIFRELDQFSLDMIEQPLYYRDLVDHSELQQELKTPLCLDESITCFQDAEHAIRMKSCKVICIKIARVGGIYEALQIHNLAMESGVACWVGSMMESGLGAVTNIEFATLPNCVYPNEITIHGKYSNIEVIDPPIEFSKPGFVSPSTRPYIGSNIDEKTIDQFTLARTILD